MDADAACWLLPWLLLGSTCAGIALAIWLHRH